jgi:hypothetical protein
MPSIDTLSEVVRRQLSKSSSTKVSWLITENDVWVNHNCVELKAGKYEIHCDDKTYKIDFYFLLPKMEYEKKFLKALETLQHMTTNRGYILEDNNFNLDSSGYFLDMYDELKEKYIPQAEKDLYGIKMWPWTNRSRLLRSPYRIYLIRSMADNDVSNT